MELEWKQVEAVKQAQPVRFAPRDWAALVVTLALAALAVFGFDDARWMPGLGMTALTFAGVGLALFTLRGQMQHSRSARFLLGCGLALALTYSVYDNLVMRLLNLVPMAASLLLGQYNLAGGGLPEGPLALSRAAGRAVADSLRHVDKPFRALSGLRQEKPGQLKGLGLGLLIAVPLLGIALVLLASADEVFGAGLSGLLRGLRFPAATDAVTDTLLSLALGLCLFSLLWGIRRPQPAAAPRERAGLPALSAGVVLGTLAAVYAAFVWVQLSYLFGGATSAAMAGGWAQYARRGFFELAAIGLLNISVLALTLPRGSGHPVLRALGGALVLLTALILVSAAWRMGLYIQAFGLSLLRLLTLWGMAMILAALIGFSVRLIRPGTALFRPLAAVALAAWVALSALGPAGLVARWNAAAYAQGRLAAIDARYLGRLGADALPVLTRLSQGGLAEADLAVQRLQSERDLPWWAWNLAQRHWDEAPDVSHLPQPTLYDFMD